MSKQIEKNNKGITIVALIVTIIVLLVLAGISISTLSGNNGILQKTIQAKEMTTTSELSERAKSAYSAALAKSNTIVTQELFQEKLNNEFTGSETAIVESSADGKKWIVKVNGVEVYSVDNDTDVEE